MGDEVFGPYCTEVDEQTGDRHRRGLWSSSSGMDMPANKEIDMVYTRTSGGGFKFSFNFEFEFELLPGLPGAGAQVRDYHNFRSISTLQNKRLSKVPESDEFLLIN